MSKRSQDSVYMRNIVFGAVDSLVSTVGLLAGIEAGSVTVPVIIMTGIVYVFVEGFSMAIGSFLSEDSAQEYAAGGDVPDSRTIIGGIVMFVAFVVIGFIPIIPYFFLPQHPALAVSIAVSIIALGIIAYIQSKLSKVPAVWRVVRMILLGGFAIIVGIIIGNIFKVA